MFVKGVYFLVFYCLFYEIDISTDMSEEQVSEEIYTDLIEEEYIRMDDSGEEHWGYIAEEGEDKNNIHALRWEIYVKDKYELIKR